MSRSELSIVNSKTQFELEAAQWRQRKDKQVRTVISSTVASKASSSSDFEHSGFESEPEQGFWRSVASKARSSSDFEGPVAAQWRRRKNEQVRAVISSTVASKASSSSDFEHSGLESELEQWFWRSVALKVRVFVGFLASSPAEQIPAHPDSVQTATQTYILIYICVIYV